jgi:hypothetical protein
MIKSGVRSTESNTAQTFLAYYNDNYRRLEAKVDFAPNPEFISRNSVTSIIASTLAPDYSTQVDGQKRYAIYLQTLLESP